MSINSVCVLLCVLSSSTININKRKLKCVLPVILVCTICSEVLENDLVGTQCGHVYHEGCLRRWTERVPTCPQCRRKRPDARRLYPNLGGEPGGGVEPARLAADLDDVRLELRTLQEQLRTCTETLQRERAEAEELSTRAVSTERAVAVLRQQAAHYKRLAGQADVERERADGLQRRVDELEKLRSLLHAGVDDVERLLAGETDIRTLATFSVALRRALADAQRQRTACREELQRTRRDLRNVEGRLRRMERPERHEPALPPGLAQLAAPAPALTPAPAPALAPAPAPALDLVPSSTTESPYLRLRQAGPALALSVKPSEQPALALRATPYSIFGGRGARSARSSSTLRPDRYDGLGGRATPEGVPAPAPAGRARAPRPTARHRLRGPTKET